MGQPASGCESHGAGANKTVPFVRYLVSEAQLRGNGKNGKVPTVEAPSKVYGQDVRSTVAGPGGRVIVYGRAMESGESQLQFPRIPVYFHGF